MPRTVVVSDEQVEAAQALIRISGGPDKVKPIIRKIAEAQPRQAAAHEPARPAAS